MINIIIIAISPLQPVGPLTAESRSLKLKIKEKIHIVV
jgi:hypothetical protein